MQFYLKLATYILMIIICALCFVTLMRIFTKAKSLGPQAAKVLDKELKKRGTTSKYKKRLSSLGIMYRVGNYDLNPSWYIIVRISVGVLLTLLLYAAGMNKAPVLLGIPIGYILTDTVFKRLNAADNKKILVDIYNTYANLNIQTKSGLYLVNALEYSYKMAKNARYKEALGELILNFSDKTVSMEESIQIFKGRFSSLEIDKLCTMLENVLQYGASSTYTSDLIGEIKALIMASTAEAEHDIESKAGIITFAFFAVIIFIVCYSVFSDFSGLGLFL